MAQPLAPTLAQIELPPEFGRRLERLRDDLQASSLAQHVQITPALVVRIALIEGMGLLEEVARSERITGVRH